ncbi:MAG: outer membrane protein assembly factor BamD, partial [Candidatus Sulfotelmatobacter sp.]
NATPPVADPNELKPNAPADPNELKPTDSGADPSLPPPVQVNEIQQGQSSSSAGTKNAADSTPASDQDMSSSKKKRKKGLQKLNPF